MVPDAVDLGLTGLYALLVVLTAVQYRRGRIARERLPLLFGLCLSWLAYGLMQLPETNLVAIGPPGSYALDGVAIGLLLAGLYGLYWWWRHGEGTASVAVD
jgi:hypothetical protein